MSQELKKPVRDIVAPARACRIRVAHLITSLALGGAQDYLLFIVRGLDQEKFEPIIVGRMDGEWVEKVQSMPGVQWFDIPALRRKISPWKDLQSVYQIRRFCREKKIDILHTHSSKAGVVGRLGGSLAGVSAIVHTVHGFSFNDVMPAWKKRFFVSIEMAMTKYTSVLLFVSEQNRRTAMKLGIGAQQSVETLHYGLDYEPFNVQFDRRAIRSSFGLDDSHAVVGFTGRLSAAKGLHILLEAFARFHLRFPHTRLLLVGDGELREDLELRARRLGVSEKVIFTGFRSDVAALLAAMDIFVMTSLWEGLSRSLAEAMYARLPIIATDAGGTSDAIRDGETGWLIEANNVDAAVDALTDALTNPGKARLMAEQGYQWARKEFDPQRMHERISQLYESLACGKKVKPRG